MDRLDELGVFVAIVDAGSLTGAARRLHRSTPAVTRALSALELRVGSRLIERSTRRLAVTDAGRVLVERARVLLGDYELVTTKAAADEVRGLIRITAPIPFGRRYVTPIVTDFLERHPSVQIEIILDDRNLDLIEQGLDLAIRIGDLADSTLRVRRIGAVKRVLVASPTYLAAHGTPDEPSDLAGHATIFATNRGGPLEWRFGRDRDTVVRLSPRLLVNEVEAQILAAKAGHGIARVLSYQAADGIADGSLVRLLPIYEPPAVPVQLVATAGQRSAKIAAFLDAAAKTLRGLDAIQAEGMP